MDLLHGLSMVSTARRGCLNALTKVVLNAADDQRGVIDSIYLCSRQGLGVLKKFLVRKVFPLTVT